MPSPNTPKRSPDTAPFNLLKSIKHAIGDVRTVALAAMLACIGGGQPDVQRTEKDHDAPAASAPEEHHHKEVHHVESPVVQEKLRNLKTVLAEMDEIGEQACLDKLQAKEPILVAENSVDCLCVSCIDGRHDKEPSHGDAGAGVLEFGKNEKHMVMVRNIVDLAKRKYEAMPEPKHPVVIYIKEHRGDKNGNGSCGAAAYSLKLKGVTSPTVEQINEEAAKASAKTGKDIADWAKEMGVPVQVISQPVAPENFLHVGFHPEPFGLINNIRGSVTTKTGGFMAYNMSGVIAGKDVAIEHAVLSAKIALGDHGMNANGVLSGRYRLFVASENKKQGDDDAEQVKAALARDPDVSNAYKQGKITVIPWVPEHIPDLKKTPELRQ